MTDKSPLSRSDVEQVLRRLEPLTAGRRIVLIGGQAVALWSAFFAVPGRSDETRVYTSKDIDFEGAGRSARKAGELLQGEVRVPSIDDSTPNTGLVIFEDSEGIARQIDFLDAPGGLTKRDVRDTAVAIEIEAIDGDPVRVLVMHPERSMESRIFNVMVLGQRGPEALPKQFITRRYPQLKAKLEEQRERDRVHKRRYAHTRRPRRR